MRKRITELAVLASAFCALGFVLPAAIPGPLLPLPPAAVPSPSPTIPIGYAYADGIQWPLRPDDKLTPGAVATTDKAVFCKVGYSKRVRKTSDSLKAERCKTYNLPCATGSHEVEIDHRVSLCLGGADVKENLWPESYKTKPWNAHLKDQLEDALLREVCGPKRDGNGPMSAVEAQNILKGDWIAAYPKHVKSKPGATPAPDPDNDGK